MTLCSCEGKLRKRNQHTTIAYKQICHGLYKIVNILYKVSTRTHLLMNELQPDDMKGVSVLHLFSDFAHKGRQKRQEYDLDGGAVINFSSCCTA